MVEAPSALRRWFVFYFAVDWAVGVPLLVAPEILLRFFGWHEIDPIATRLFAAALIAIGGQSLLGRNGSVNEFRAMLNLKLIWAAAAVIALGIGVLSGGPALTWLGLAVFVGFFRVWLYWRIRIGRAVRLGEFPHVTRAFRIAWVRRSTSSRPISKGRPGAWPDSCREDRLSSSSIAVIGDPTATGSWPRTQEAGTGSSVRP